jgi:prepilin-type N-terminal cleavage/methylation domain-containing protein
MSQQKGFTMLELLVSIGIIALLALLAIVSLSNIQERNRDLKRLNDMYNMKSAIEEAAVMTGGYETAGCTAGLASSCAGEVAKILSNVRQINDPANATPCDALCSNGACNYSFAEAPTDDGYELFFYLEVGDGELGEGCYKMTPTGIFPVQ